MSGNTTEKRKTARHSKRFHATINGVDYHGLDISNVGFSFYVSDKGSIIIPRGKSIAVTISYCHLGERFHYEIPRCQVANMTISRDEKNKESSIYGIAIKSMPPDISHQHYHFVHSVFPTAYCKFSELAKSPNTQNTMPTPQVKSQKVADYRLDELRMILLELETEAMNENISDARYRTQSLLQIQEMIDLIKQP